MTNTGVLALQNMDVTSGAFFWSAVTETINE